MIDEFEQKLRACHTRGLDGVEELETGQGGSQRAPSAKKPAPGMVGSPGATARTAPQAAVPGPLSEPGSLPLPAPRHQAASDSDFATPAARRPTRRQPHTQQRAFKKKPQIVFSSDESSEDGRALRVALGAAGPAECRPARLPPSLDGGGLSSVVWSKASICSLPYFSMSVTQRFLPLILGLELSAEMTEEETPRKTTPLRRASTRRRRS